MIEKYSNIIGKQFLLGFWRGAKQKRTLRIFLGRGDLSPEQKRRRLRVATRRFGRVFIQHASQAVVERLFSHRSVYAIAFSPPFLEGLEWRNEAGVQRVFPMTAMLTDQPSSIKEEDGPQTSILTQERTWEDTTSPQNGLPRPPKTPRDVLDEAEQHALEQTLSAMMQHERWHLSRIILVLPTAFLRMRVIPVPTQDVAMASKILPLALAESTLDDLKGYTWRFSLQQHRSNASASAFVFMQSSMRLQQIGQTVEKLGFGVMRSVSALHLLHHAWPPPQQGIHFKVYIGADEVFVCSTAGGHLRQIQHIPSKVGAVLKQALAPISHTPFHVWKSLLGKPAASAHPGMLRQGWTPKAFSEALQQALQAILLPLNRFIVAEAPSSQTHEVRILGVFAPCFKWDTKALQLCFEWHLSALLGDKKEHWGVLAALPAGKSTTFSAIGKSPSFYRSPTPWLAWLKTRRFAASTLAILLGGWLLFEVVGFGLKQVVQKAQQHNVQAQITHLLHLPRGASMQRIKAALNERKQNLRKVQGQQQRLQRFITYDYEMSRMLALVSQGVAQREETFLKKMYIGREQLQINGETKRFEDVEALKSYLLNLPAFQDYKGNVSQKRSEGKVVFRIQITKAK